MNTTERLNAHLKELDHAEVHGAGVQAVMDAGKRYQRRRLVGMTVAGVAAVAFMAVGAAALQSAISNEPTEVADSNENENENREDATVISGELDWVAYESPVNWANELVTADGTIYALTTAPGTRNVPFDQVPQAIFTTTDGEGWSHQTLGSDLWIQDLDVRDDTLYAIGTAPGVSAIDGDATVRIGTSDDAGASWAYTDLPLTASPPAELPVDFANHGSTIAVGDEVIVALANTQFYGDFSSVAPAEFSGESFQTMPTDEGIRVVDWNLVNAAQADCMGNDGEVFREGIVVDDGGVLLDGLEVEDLAQAEELERVEAAADPDPEPAAPLTDECEALMRGGAENSDEFVVYTATWDELGIEGGPTAFSELFVSANGTDFERVESPLPATGTAELTAVDGGFVAHVSEMSSTVWFSPDGRSWDEMTGLPHMDWVQDVGQLGDDIVVIGTSGASAVVASSPGPAGPWTGHELPVDDNGGESFINGGDVAASGVALAVAGLDASGNTSDAVLLHSSDLDAWSVTPLTEVVGPRSAYVNAVAVSGDRIDVSLSMSDDRSGTVLHLWAVGATR